jgi:hypothetical protein
MQVHVNGAADKGLVDRDAKSYVPVRQRKPPPGSSSAGQAAPQKGHGRSHCCRIAAARRQNDERSCRTPTGQPIGNPAFGRLGKARAYVCQWPRPEGDASVAVFARTSLGGALDTLLPRHISQHGNSDHRPHHQLQPCATQGWMALLAQGHSIMTFLSKKKSS